MQQPEIFISYAWGGESEKIVDTLYNTFTQKGYTIIRDKINLDYKGSITSFMDKIGQGKYVIVVISDKYLKSENCMYEIVQIAKNGQFHDRIFPIVLSDANFYKPTNRIKYISHWEQQKKELNESMKSLDDMSMISEIQKELANYNEIHQNISNILFVLKDMNTLTPEMHQDSNFEVMIRAIDQKVALDNELNQNFKQADEELKNRIIAQQNKEYAYDLFLSFSNQNKAEVEKTAAIFRQYGLRVFVSNDSLSDSIGSSFGDQINYALEHSQHFVLLCTPESMASKWVKGEHEAFFNHCYDLVQNRRFFILKGIHFTDKLLPLTYRTLQYAETPTDIVKVLGIATPKATLPLATPPTINWEQRKENYKKFFRLLYKDGLIDHEEHEALAAKQLELGLSEQQVKELQNAVKQEASAEIKQRQQVQQTELRQVPANTERLQREPEQKQKVVPTLHNPKTDTAYTKYVVGIALTAALALGIFKWTNNSSSNNPVQNATPTAPTVGKEQPSEQPSATPLEEQTETAISYPMVLAVGGTYKMGCENNRDADCQAHELPAHTATVKDFYIGKYEVTQAQWQLIMGKNPSSHQNCAECPVTNVSWQDVQRFIQQLNAKTQKAYRLPTEAEWEYAARGGNRSQQYAYAGANVAEEVAWYNDNSERTTHPVGQKKPNELGLYDCSGNVWEWTASSWTANYEEGAKASKEYVLRGGAWRYAAPTTRLANRVSRPVIDKNTDSGFRLCLAK